MPVPTTAKRDLPTPKRFTLARLNREFAREHVAVFKGEGYFYVYGTTPEMANRLALLNETSIYVYRFDELSERQWVDAVNDVLIALEESEK